MGTSTRLYQVYSKINIDGDGPRDANWKKVSWEARRHSPVDPPVPYEEALDDSRLTDPRLMSAKRFVNACFTLDEALSVIRATEEAYSSGVHNLVSRTTPIHERLGIHRGLGSGLVRDRRRVFLDVKGLDLDVFGYYNAPMPEEAGETSDSLEPLPF